MPHKSKQEMFSMKKIIATVAATAIIVGFSTMNASAWNHGNGGYHMMGPEMMNGGAYNANLSQQTRDEINKIQVKLSADQAELTALMSSANPDTQRIRTLSEQVSTRQIALQSKYGATGYGYGHNMMGPGMMNGGYGGYGCWW